MSIAGIVVIAVAVVIVLWWIATVNGFRRMKVAIQEAWSGIDVQLKRKANIIPNLVILLRCRWISRVKYLQI